jgi:hypothetical protein
MPDTPYWLTREWWSSGDPPHYRRGVAELWRAYPEVARCTWQSRRDRAKQTLPDLEWVKVIRGGHTPLRDPAPEPVDMTPEVAQAKYDETTEILEDGSHRSDKLLEMSAEQSKDAEYLLRAHGFDPCEWDLLSARNNIWNVYSKNAEGDGHDISTLYSSRITAKPLKGRFDLDAIVAAVRAAEPVHVEPCVDVCDGMLEINNTDMHLGNSTLEWYRDSLSREVALIRSRTWAEVVIPIGSDLFHVDNFKNTTSNGTLQSSVAWPEAWAGATAYFSTIIEAALERSGAVYAYYVIGNHDESMAWAFCQMLAAKYPQVVFDLDIAERKVHRYRDIALGMTHGDNKTRKDLDRIFMAEFPSFNEGVVREVHAGHFHHEVARDEYGVVVRSLSTAARTDKWHREEGYVGAVKRFMAFEYTPDSLAAIHYM